MHIFLDPDPVLHTSGGVSILRGFKYLRAGGNPLASDTRPITSAPRHKTRQYHMDTYRKLVSSIGQTRLNVENEDRQPGDSDLDLHSESPGPVGGPKSFRVVEARSMLF